MDHFPSIWTSRHRVYKIIIELTNNKRFSVSCDSNRPHFFSFFVFACAWVCVSAVLFGIFLEKTHTHQIKGKENKIFEMEAFFPGIYCEVKKKNRLLFVSIRERCCRALLRLFLFRWSLREQWETGVCVSIQCNCIRSHIDCIPNANNTTMIITPSVSKSERARKEKKQIKFGNIYFKVEQKRFVCVCCCWFFHAI